MRDRVVIEPAASAGRGGYQNAVACGQRRSGTEIEKSERLEAAIREMTRPTGGQYPRPWMTNLRDPSTADVFTVGMNQRNGYPVDKFESHKHYVDSLFNRGHENCDQVYDRITGGDWSPTRKNTLELVKALRQYNVIKVLQTNVICFSTPMSADLRKSINIAGTKQGGELFRSLFALIEPKVLIVHGAGATRKLARAIGYRLPEPLSEPGDPVRVTRDELDVFIIPSLAPPAASAWHSWRSDHLEAVASEVAHVLRRRR